VTPSAACRALADVGIQTWSGDYYATAVMDELGLAGEGGALRIGFVHYTSVGEVDAVLEALEDLSRSS
jgi:selenocysteine lyase/cysteine desulfurase